MEIIFTDTFQGKRIQIKKITLPSKHQINSQENKNLLHRWVDDYLDYMAHHHEFVNMSILQPYYEPYLPF